MIFPHFPYFPINLISLRGYFRQVPHSLTETLIFRDFHNMFRLQHNINLALLEYVLLPNKDTERRANQIIMEYSTENQSADKFLEEDEDEVY